VSSVVIIPTIGAPALRRAVESVAAQTVPTACYVVCDGESFRPAVEDALAGAAVDRARLAICVLPRNVGAGGFYGHRVLAAFSHLVDEDHVLFLDQDNFLAPDHVAHCVDLIAARRLLVAVVVCSQTEREASYNAPPR
jgi:glycosyltransferase involved in cell wall biosynthesis